MDETYEAAHARLILDFAEVTAARRELLRADKMSRLPEPSQTAADKSYDETLTKLYDGLDAVLKSYERSPDAARMKMFQLWKCQIESDNITREAKRRPVPFRPGFGRSSRAGR